MKHEDVKTEKLSHPAKLYKQHQTTCVIMHLFLDVISHWDNPPSTIHLFIPSTVLIYALMQMSCGANGFDAFSTRGSDLDTSDINGNRLLVLFLFNLGVCWQQL